MSVPSAGPQNSAKERFLEYLRSLDDQTTPCVSYGLKSFSIGDIIREVENETEDGRQFVSMFADSLLDDDTRLPPGPDDDCTC